MDVLSISTPASLLFILHRSAYASKSVPVIYTAARDCDLLPPLDGEESTDGL